MQRAVGRIAGGLVSQRHVGVHDLLGQACRARKQGGALVRRRRQHTPLEQLPHKAERNLALELAADRRQDLDSGRARLPRSGPQKRRLPHARWRLDDKHDALAAPRCFNDFADGGDFEIALKHCDHQARRSPVQRMAIGVGMGTRLVSRPL